MAAFFDLPSFFRRVSKPLLERYFAEFPAFADFDWTAISARRIDPLLQRFNALAPEHRRQAFEVFRRVEPLATSTGTQALIEAGRKKDDSIPGKLAAMQNGRDRALWMSLEHPDVIDPARTLARIDSLSKKFWETRQGLPVMDIEVTDSMKAELSRQIIDLFQPEQCRGQYCVVEHVRREGGIDCFFAYPADYLKDWEGYDSHGQFERGNNNPAFKILFAYHSMDGKLDTYSPGGRKMRDRLAHIFTRSVLGADQELALADLDCFDLEILKDPNLTFPTDPSDHIALVRIQSLRLKFHGSHPSTIEVSIEGRRREGSIHAVIAEKFRDPQAAMASATVSSAVLQAFILAPSGRESSLCFRLSAPSFCDLEDAPEEQVLRRYLRVWKIEKDADRLATAA